MLRAQWAGSPRIVPTESLTYKSPYKELYAISVWPHAAFSQRATYPPSAAVRQRSIALITFNWSRLICPLLASRQAGP